MKRLIFSIIVTFIFQIVSAQKWVEMMNDPNVSFFEVQKEFNSFQKGKDIEEINGWKQYKRWEYFMENHIDSDGFFRNQEAANKIYNEYINSKIYTTI